VKREPSWKDRTSVAAAASFLHPCTSTAQARGPVPCHPVAAPLLFATAAVRHFHASLALAEIVQFNLSDIGEGIKEVTVKVFRHFLNLSL
jgi:hypothetical protein